MKNIISWTFSRPIELEFWGTAWFQQTPWSFLPSMQIWQTVVYLKPIYRGWLTHLLSPLLKRGGQQFHPGETNSCAGPLLLSFRLWLWPWLSESSTGQGSRPGWEDLSLLPPQPKPSYRRQPQPSVCLRKEGEIQRWGYFLCVTCIFGILFLTETMFIRGCVGVYVDVLLEFFLIFLCGYWVAFNSVYTLKKYSLINSSAFNLKDKQSLCNSRSLPGSRVVFPEVSSPRVGK